MDSLEKWKQAWWDYILEHSEIDRGGTIFIKFHTGGRWQLEGHIEARMKGYHREDPRVKEKLHEVKKLNHIISKKVKRDEYKKRMRLVRLKLKIVKLINNVKNRIQKLSSQRLSGG